MFMTKEDAEVLLSILVLVLNHCLGMHYSKDHRIHPSTCCDGTLGYAWDERRMPCSAMTCCNGNETVAVIPTDYALGFCFRCMPRDRIRPECYSAGVDVRSTNQSPDYTPRTCCDDAKFTVVMNKWYAGMTIRCVAR